jgi:hypothetical protein
MLSPAGTRTVNEANDVHLTQEKHPVSQQILSEDSDSASSQEVRPQTIEATGPTRAWDEQEAYEQGMVLKNVGLFRQAAEHCEKNVQDSTYSLKCLAQRGLILKNMENRKRPWRLFVVHCKCLRSHRKNKCRSSTPQGKR